MTQSPTIYIVTDIEADGPTPGENSMLSFASVAISEDGQVHGEFETVLAALNAASGHPSTLAWFKAQPEAWAAATCDPQPPELEMRRFETWVEELPGVPMFAAHPLMFDGAWIDFYMRRFLNKPLMTMPWQNERLFVGAGLCIRSYAKGVLGAKTPKAGAGYPDDWVGHHPHTHRAIDDARGYAHLLAHLMRVARAKSDTHGGS